MSIDSEVKDLLLRHLQSIQENDIETYHATTSPDLTLYEWWITPHQFHNYAFLNQQISEIFSYNHTLI